MNLSRSLICIVRAGIVILLMNNASAAQKQTGISEDLAEKSKQVEKLFSDYLLKEGPGCAVGISLQGEVVHAKGYGYANMDYNIPLTTDSVFRIASLSKQFTALAIALLVEKNKINMEDNIVQYLPELHSSTHNIKIKELISHSSGLPDLFDIIHLLGKSIAGGPMHLGNKDYINEADFYRLTTQVTLTPDAGNEFYYSNLGYFWLARIIERVSGQTLKRFAQDNIFEPTGLKNTFFNDNVNSIVPLRATGYSYNYEYFEVFETNLDWVGDGGVYSSINDFLVWDKQFYLPTIGKRPRQLRNMLISNIDGMPKVRHDVVYSYGLYVIDEADNDTIISHSGEWVGFSTIYTRFLSQHFSYSIFCNLVGEETSNLGKKIESIYLH